MRQNKENKERVTAWLYPEMIDNMNGLMSANGMKNYTEFIEKAVDFYIGYLGSQSSTTYLSKILLEAISGISPEITVQSQRIITATISLSLICVTQPRVTATTFCISSTSIWTSIVQTKKI